MDKGDYLRIVFAQEPLGKRYLLQIHKWFLILLVWLGSCGVLYSALPAPSTSVKLVDGKFGKALDASISPVEVNGNPAFRKPPLTVECWAKLHSQENFNILVASDHKSSGEHWEFYTYAQTGRLAAYFPGMRPSELVCDVDVCDGKWHYLAMTYDGKGVELFVDGESVLNGQVKPREGKAPEPGPLTIGQVVVDIKERIGCDGLIDDVRISSIVRAIKDVPEKPLALDQETVGLWRFDLVEAADVDPAWTPRPAVGDAPPWEKETDKDWVDDRLQEMDTGPFFNATIQYPTPHGNQRALRGSAVKLHDGKVGVLFDRNRLRLCAGWVGGYLTHSSRRFGLLNTPRPDGEIVFTSTDRPGWTSPQGKWEGAGPPTAPLPQEWSQFQGIYLHGEQTIFAYEVGEVDIRESSSAETIDDEIAIARTVEVAPAKHPMTMAVCDLVPKSLIEMENRNGAILLKATHDNQVLCASLIGDGGKLKFGDGGQIEAVITPHQAPIRFKVLIWKGAEADVDDFAKLVNKSPAPRLPDGTKPNGLRWGEPLVTQGEVAPDDSAYVIDTLTIPYQNRFNALFFVSGIDFLGDKLAVCTAHGDVWLIGGVDESLKHLTWQRYATGLYQPLGLKVVDGKVIVLERGQLTRLHDFNDDGEADFCECFSDGWHIGGGEHSFHTCLETDPEGYFYFFCGGDVETPTGGCLMRVSPDGSQMEVFSTGFRHPIGLGASPEGWITGADQEGNWMPSTRVDVYRKGGFYGDMRAHHRKVPPKTYDPPLCWLPRQMDNSAGGQVWAPKQGFGPLSGGMLHLSYGKCRMMLIMPQEVDGVLQAGAVDLGLQFLSGIARGRFRDDGHLYVVGLDGWQTAAVRDGCVQRVRYTGKPLTIPVKMAVHKNGIHLTFSEELNRAAATDVDHWKLSRWNYHWSADYGSKRWSVVNPKRVGQDDVPVESVSLSADGRSVFLAVPDLKPVMQMEIRYGVEDVAGKPVSGTVYHTIHRLGKKFTQ